jgi:hypothetical protein
MTNQTFQIGVYIVFKTHLPEQGKHFYDHISEKRIYMKVALDVETGFGRIFKD